MQFRKNLQTTLEKVIFQESAPTQKKDICSTKKLTEYEKIRNKLGPFKTLITSPTAIIQQYQESETNIQEAIKKGIKAETFKPTNETLNKYAPLPKKTTLQKPKRITPSKPITEPEKPKTQTKPKKEIPHQRKLEIKRQNLENCLELVNKFGATAHSQIINPYERANFMQTIDSEIYKKVDTFLNSIRKINNPSSKQKKQAYQLQQFIQNAWGTTDYKMLENLNKIANQYQK